MANEHEIIEELNRLRPDERREVLELERLMACYQAASAEDRRVVWAVLSRYAPRCSC